jgi:hypothetical protein
MDFAKLYKKIVDAASTERGVMIELSNREHRDLAPALGVAMGVEMAGGLLRQVAGCGAEARRARFNRPCAAG